MKIIILCTTSETYSIQRFQEEDSSVIIFNPYEHGGNEIEHFCTRFNPDEFIIFNRISGIRYDDRDLIFLEQIRERGFKVFGDLKQYRVFRCKWSQYQFYTAHNIPTIKTFNLEDLGKEGHRTNIKTEIHKLQSDSLFCKPKRSNQGKGIVEVKSLKGAVESILDGRYVLQPYIPKEREYRVLMLKNQALGVIEKRALDNEKILNAKSSKISFLEYDQSFQELVAKIPSKISELVNLPFYAIDLIVDPNQGPKVLEVNLCPGFEYFEKSSHINIAHLVMSSLKK